MYDVLNDLSIKRPLHSIRHERPHTHLMELERQVCVCFKVYAFSCTQPKKPWSSRSRCGTRRHTFTRLVNDPDTMRANRVHTDTTHHTHANSVQFIVHLCVIGTAIQYACTPRASNGYWKNYPQLCAAATAASACVCVCCLFLCADHSTRLLLLLTAQHRQHNRQASHTRKTHTQQFTHTCVSHTHTRTSSWGDTRAGRHGNNNVMMTTPMMLSYAAGRLFSTLHVK